MLKFREKWTAPSGTFKLERRENKQKLAKSGSVQMTISQ